jgi:hypothetical protein
MNLKYYLFWEKIRKKKTGKNLDLLIFIHIKEPLIFGEGIIEVPFQFNSNENYVTKGSRRLINSQRG